jgi:hypothetical protein
MLLSGFLWGIGAAGGVTVGAIALWLLNNLAAPAVREWFRDRAEERRARAAESRAHARADEPHRARIISALESEVSSLRRSMYGGQFSNVEWQGWHNKLAELVESTDGARALGDTYAVFSKTLKSDQRAINIACSAEREQSAVILPEKSSAARLERYLNVAHSLENRASMLLDFAGLMRILEHPDADDCEKYALRQTEQAEQMQRNYTSSFDRLSQPYDVN